MSHKRLSLSVSPSLLLSLSHTGSNCIVNFRPAVSPVAGLHTKPPSHFSLLNNVPLISIQKWWWKSNVLFLYCLVCTQFSHFAARSFSSELNLPACLVTCCLFPPFFFHVTVLIWLSDPASHCTHYIKHTENKHNTSNNVTNICLSFGYDTTAEEVLGSFTFDFLINFSSWLKCCSELALRFGFLDRLKGKLYSRFIWRLDMKSRIIA